MKNVIIPIVLVALGAGGAVIYLSTSRGGGEEAPEAGMCAKHEIAEAECPWCDPGLVEKMGECKEHGVPEALCHQCNPALVAGFKAEFDWCGGHGVPESQCGPCNPGGTSNAVPGQCGKHQLPNAECPFCDKELVEKMGECGEHGVPEALCYKCNPALAAGFKAEGDWCGEHTVPESQCEICNGK